MSPFNLLHGNYHKALSCIIIMTRVQKVKMSYYH